jgi:hypothetical protein
MKLMRSMNTSVLLYSARNLVGAVGVKSVLTPVPIGCSFQLILIFLSLAEILQAWHVPAGFWIQEQVLLDGSTPTVAVIGHERHPLRSSCQKKDSHGCDLFR